MSLTRVLVCCVALFGRVVNMYVDNALCHCLDVSFPAVGSETPS